MTLLRRNQPRQELVCTMYRRTQSSARRVHRVLQPAPLEQTLHLSHLFGHRCCRRAKGDEAEVCGACGRRLQVRNATRRSHR